MTKVGDVSQMFNIYKEAITNVGDRELFMDFLLYLHPVGGISRGRTTYFSHL